MKRLLIAGVLLGILLLTGCYSQKAVRAGAKELTECYTRLLESRNAVDALQLQQVYQKHQTVFSAFCDRNLTENIGETIEILNAVCQTEEKAGFVSAAAELSYDLAALSRSGCLTADSFL